MADEQLKLFIWPNALQERFGPAFFRALPTCAGVYLMSDSAGRIIYVGKARNLRQRLGSYRYAGEQCSPKTSRLVARVTRIQWRVCPSEEAALLEENRLLRELRPRFNRANTWPRAARFISIAAGPNAIELSLNAEPHGECYGAFKGASRQNFHALLRLLATWEDSYANLPRPLLLERGPRRHAFAPNNGLKWLDSLRALLRGESDELLRRFSAAALEERGPFYTAFRQEDLLVGEHFFRIGPWRNRLLREQFGAPELIAQEDLDDLLVRHRQSQRADGADARAAI